MLEPGAILQDRYKIIEPIGKGGMGSVYRARDLRLRTDVALKETLFTDEVYRRAFEHEAQILARLRHQALPRVIDHFIEGHGQFLVMEFIRGEDLGNQLARLGPRFATPQAMPMILRWTDQLLDVLHYIHSRPRPVIHRDIKPRNLKLTQNYDIILLDFGLARGGVTILADPPGVGADRRKVYGFTPPYAPLEQMRDGEPDQRSDLYSLAATIYHLLTAAMPADAMTRMARLMQSQPDPLKPLRQLAPHVPDPVARVIEHALELLIDARPATAREMRAELARARADTVAEPRPESLPHIPSASLHPGPTPAAPGSPPTSEPAVSAPESDPRAANSPSTPRSLERAGSEIPIAAHSQPLPGDPSPAMPIGTLLRMLTTGSPIRSLDFSPSGELLAAGYDDHTVGLWRMRDYAHTATLRGHISSVRSVRFAPRGGFLATGSDDETVGIWRVSDRTLLRQLKLPGCPIESIAFSPSGALAAVGGWGSSVTLCQIEGDRVSVIDSLACPFVHSLSFSPDSSLLAAGGYDGAVYLWNVADRLALEPLAGFSTFILSVAFSPDGELLAASSHSSVRVWRMSDQKPVELLQGHTGPVHAIAFSPDARILAAGGEDRTVRLWPITEGTTLPVPLQHRAGVASLCYSPDGATLATGTHDGRICLWRVGT